MSTKLTVQLIAQILQRGLTLTDDQIWIYNQRREIPPTPGLFVIVELNGVMPYGSQNKFNPATDTETLSQTLQEMITIHAFSRDTTAVERMAEIFGVLNSTYSQQVQELEGFKIGVVPTTVNDVSSLEGAALLYRIDITLRVLRGYSITRAVDVYDTFSHELLTEKGVIEC